jgi:hypothetical protein
MQPIPLAPSFLSICQTDLPQRIDTSTLWTVRGMAIEQARRMRKRYRIVLLASLVGALVVPVGFALSIDTAAVATQLVHPGLLPGAVAPPRLPWTMPDAAKLLGVGTLLLGLAAVVKKTGKN